MSFIQDWYWKKYKKTGFEIKQHSGLIDIFGELSCPLSIGDHVITPIDKTRDINKCDQPQRLKVEINQAVEAGTNAWNPSSLLGDISSILSLVSGRIVRLRDGFVYEKDGEDIVCGYGEGRTDRHHPNLYCPIIDKNIQSRLTELFDCLNFIRTDIDVEKHQSIIKALNLYRDSLIILPYDEDTSYMLLVAAGEVLGSKFSSIVPTFSDISNSKSILEFCNRNGFSTDLVDELKNILLEPSHLKLKAKFVDVIKNNLSETYFDTPHVIMIPKGKVSPDGKIIEISEWHESPSPQRMKKEELEGALKNIYNCRSSFVHDGQEWPMRSKIGGGHDLLSPLDTDKAGNVKKNSDGSYKLAKPIPTYFGFERIMNDVLSNIIIKFGK